MRCTWKPLILILCHKSCWQNWREAIGEYQVSSASPCPGWSVAFTTSAKLARSNRRVSGELSFSQSNMVRRLTTLAKLARSNRRVSGELSMSQSSVVHRLFDLGKTDEKLSESIRWAEYVPVQCGPSPLRPRQNWREAIGEYQVNWVCPSPVWSVAFTISLKASKAAELGLMLPKYSKTFDSLNWYWGSSDAGALGNVEQPFIVIAPWSTLSRNGTTWPPPIDGLNSTNCIFMLNWIVWIRTVWINWMAWNVFHN